MQTHRTGAVSLTILALVVSLTACHRGASTAVPTTGARTTSTPVKPSTDPFAAKAVHFYEIAGATRIETACLAARAPLQPPAKSPSSVILRPGNDPAVKCVGSEARVRAILLAVQSYFAKHPRALIDLFAK